MKTNFNSMKSLYQKYFEGRASVKEKKEILYCIKSSKEGLEDFQRQKEQWKKGDDKLISLATWKAWKRIEKEINSGHKQHNKWMFVAAASILLFIFASTGLYFSSHSQQNFFAIQTKAGQLTTVVLPDSTEVDINSSSKITYRSRCFGLKRQVVLNGEAYFHVNSKPFSDFDVLCNDIRVNVTGTRFNVNGYENEDVKVVLEEGSVDFTIINENIKKSMLPGDMIIYSSANNKIIRKKVETENYTSWKDGVLYFKNNKLPNLLKSIERRYDVKFGEITDPVLKDITMTFTLRNESIESVMSLISTALPVKITTNNEIINIQLDKEKYQKMNK